jgi:hypothetical protein
MCSIFGPCFGGWLPPIDFVIFAQELQPDPSHHLYFIPCSPEVGAGSTQLTYKMVYCVHKVPGPVSGVHGE